MGDQDLDGHRSLYVRIQRPKDHTETAAAQFGLDFILADLLESGRAFRIAQSFYNISVAFTGAPEAWEIFGERMAAAQPAMVRICASLSRRSSENSP